MRFVLFIIANALLFIRPSELVAELAAVEIYRWFILACLLVSLPVVFEQVSIRYPGVPPIVACVLLLLPAVVLSGLFHGNVELIEETAIEFTKIVIYFVLLISLVNDTSHLRQFLAWIAVFSAVVTLIAVLRYHTDLTLPAPPIKANPGNKAIVHGTYVVDKTRDANTGELVDVQRMCGTGIFNDPNDFALILITAIPLCLYWLTDPAQKAMRPFWIMLLLLFAYALLLTYSRGGFLALVMGLMTLFYLHFGGAKTALLAAGGLPLVFVFLAGRMTNISADEGTGQTRIQLWSDGLTIFQNSPLFGIGMENYRQFSSHVAHHSFIHCFTELGVIGGTLFLGAFYFALKGMYDLRDAPSDQVDAAPDETGAGDPELRRLHPYLMAMLVAYTIGICFLSRSYIVPTYLVLGLAVVFMRMHANQVVVPLPAWTLSVWPRLAGISCCFLVVSYTIVRLFVRW